jgi:hypothetical protein
MMARHSAIRATGVASIFGAAGPALDEIGLSAWIAQAEPGETLVYHRGFLAVDTFGSASPLSPERRSALRRTADAALRAAEQDLVHLVQARIGPDQFAYIAIARRKPRQAGAVPLGAPARGRLTPIPNTETEMPFPENTPGIDELINLPVGEIALLPVDLLAAMQREIDAAAKQMKAVTARFNTALEVRFATRAAEVRSASGKDTGTVRFDEGDFTIVADLPKRVDWDQDRLAAMVERIRAAGDDPAEYVEISFKVPERNYVAWPEAIRQGFEPARTVRTGTLKVEILPQGGAQ